MPFFVARSVSDHAADAAEYVGVSPVVWHPAHRRSHHRSQSSALHGFFDCHGAPSMKGNYLKARWFNVPAQLLGS